MQCLNALRASALRISALPTQPYISNIAKRFRKSSLCDTCYAPWEQKPCFDISNITIERANACHAKLIRSFLYTHYWPREPTIVGLWMDLNSPYLEILTDSYSNSGERFLAFERIKRTNERKLVGVTVSNRVYPWLIEELEEWAHYTISKPERHRMYFCAHCLKSPNLFKKYKVDYIYEIECLATAQEVAGLSVGTVLLKNALASAQELRHPLVMVVSSSAYNSKICEKCGMKLVWTMDYTDFVDQSGQRVFYPRRPHHTVSVYIKYFDPKIGGIILCKPPF